MTSLQMSTAGSFDWLGGLAADFLNWAPDEPAKDASKKCAALDNGLFETTKCDKPGNFMCEAKKLEK